MVHQSLQSMPTGRYLTTSAILPDTRGDFSSEHDRIRAADFYVEGGKCDFGAGRYTMAMFDEVIGTPINLGPAASAARGA
ncbi:MAG: hypothetical protein QGH74_01545, partial [Candidatus Brocadiia bacterium]|nr:hypothetical protein [Candidatus Brocadiia bacterium]